MRRLLAVFSAILLTFLGVLAAPQSASAAPLPATYTGSAGGDIVDFDLNVVGGLTVAGARTGISQSTVDSSADTAVTSRAANLDAAVAGLDLTVVERTQVAPPNEGGAETDTIANAAVPGVLDLGTLTTSVEANYAGDAVCVADGLLADSRISTTGVTVGGDGATNVARTGDARTQGVVELVPEPAGAPLNRAVQSTATGTTSDSSFLDGAVQVDVAETPTLVATATGEPGGADVTYTPGDVTVTANGDSTTLDVGETQTFTVPAGEVQITANDVTETEAPDGQTATGSVNVVTALVTAGTAGVPVSTSTVDLLPLTAAAAVPEGGIECPLDAPTLDAPADGSTTTDTTPTFTGNAEPNSDLEIFVDGDPIGTTTADDEGNFSFTPTDPLPLGDRSALAQATLNGVTSPDSNTNNFAINAAAVDAPTLTTPADGSTTTDTTPPFTGTAEPGSTVEVFVDGESIGTTTADDDGTFSFTPTTPLQPGEQTATVTATLDGVTSAPSAGNDFIVDGDDDGDVATPVITSPEDGSITNDATPTITGTADPGSTVTIIIDGEEVGTTTTDADGNFSFTPTEPLDRGVHDVSAIATDADGNESDESFPVVFLVVDDGGNGGDNGNGGGNAGAADGGNNGGGIAGALANTGGPGLLIGLLAALGLAGGAATLVVARKRRAAAL